MGSNRKGRDADAALCKKGFQRNKSGDHIRYSLADKPYIRTKMSHGMLGSALSAERIGDMARQLLLSKKQFLDLIDCHLDAAGYQAIIERLGSPQDKR